MKNNQKCNVVWRFSDHIQASKFSLGNVKLVLDPINSLTSLIEKPIQIIARVICNPKQISDVMKKIFVACNTCALLLSRFLLPPNCTFCNRIQSNFGAD